MTFRLGDDGTLDTVVVCEDCGHEDRYTFAATDPGPNDNRTDDEAYQDFVSDCLRDSDADHECEQPCATCGGGGVVPVGGISLEPILGPCPECVGS